MKDKHYYNELLGFYSELLTVRQKELMEYYFSDDLSLSEISENLGITKSAVSDIIKRVQNSLQNYEDKLKLVAKHKKRLEICKNDADLYNKLLHIEEGE